MIFLILGFFVFSTELETFKKDYKCFSDFKKLGTANYKQAVLGAEAPTWDTTYLYSSYKSSNIEDDLHGAYKDAVNFKKRFEDKLIKENFTDIEMLDAIKLYENIIQTALVPLNYVNNLSNINLLDENIRIKLNSVQNDFADLNKEISFFETLLAISSENFQTKLLNSKKLEQYKTYLINIFKTKPYVLSDEEEKIIIDKDLNGVDAWVKFRNIYESKFTFKMPNDPKEYNLSQLVKLLSNKNEKIRKTAANLYLEKFKNENEVFAFIYNSIIQDAIRMDTGLRGFDSIFAKMNFQNSLDEETVENLHSVVKSNYKLAQRYWKLKAKILKIKKFTNADVYAPYVLEEQVNFTYIDAISIIQTSLDNFFPPYSKIFENLYRCSLVSATMTKGKKGGAYCSSFGNKAPLVFMNFAGLVSDVFTLAHEGGHFLHFVLMGENESILNNNVPIPVAETASQFNEVLVTQNMMQTYKHNKKFLISLLMQRVDDMIASIYRQTAFSFFEQEVFKRSKKATLKSEDFPKIFEKHYSKLFGKAVIMNPDYKYEWARIPHFLSTPFYVYSYAFGDLISASLYEKYLDKPKNFGGAYLRFLSLGSSLSPKELYMELGIDISKKATWEDSFKYLERLIDEIEYLNKVI